MKVNIDKLEIAFRRSEEFEGIFKRLNELHLIEEQMNTEEDFTKRMSLFEQVESLKEQTPNANELEIRFGDFVLRWDKDYRTAYKNAYAVYIFGTDKIGYLYWETYQLNRNEHIYFKAINNILYADWNTTINELMKNLKLEFSHISKLDVCVDTPKHIVRNLRNKMKDKSIIWVINGRKVTNTKKNIKGGIWVLPLNIEGLNEEDRSLYIEQEEGLRLAIYDKTREIEEKSNKYYIIEEEEQKVTDIYRAEVRLQRKHINDILKAKDITDEDLYELIQDKENLKAIFDEVSRKMLRFWYKKSLKGIIDIC